MGQSRPQSYKTQISRVLDRWGFALPPRNMKVLDGQTRVIETEAAKVAIQKHDEIQPRFESGLWIEARTVEVVTETADNDRDVDGSPDCGCHTNVGETTLLGLC